MKTAYIVLSVTDIRELLKRAVADQKAAKRDNDNHCIVLEGIGLNDYPDSSEIQISSASFILAARKALPLAPKAPKVWALYSFNFAGGGYNSVFAPSLVEARKLARSQFPKFAHLIENDSFQRHAGKAAQDRYHKSLPHWD